jgi:biopolymer transport protein ExbD
MARRTRSNRGDLPLSADINITSLVDVAFTLLVIFIITAPALQGGIEVEVPEADVDPIRTAENSLIVTVQADGRVFMEETALSVDEFRRTFPQLMEAAPRDIVYLRGDRRAPYEAVAQVLSVLNRTGVNFGLVAEPWQER